MLLKSAAKLQLKPLRKNASHLEFYPDGWRFLRNPFIDQDHLKFPGRSSDSSGGHWRWSAFGQAK